jgi:hypothetical protein
MLTANGRVSVINPSGIFAESPQLAHAPGGSQRLTATGN